ncbi:protein kinase domain-containing protein [Empedobacter brevis]
MSTTHKKYKHIQKLGQGGNGIVWKVSDGKKEYAKKTITKNKNKTAYKRFRDEINIIRKTPHKGIITIIDYYLPNGQNITSNPFYIMPLGVPLKNYLDKIIPLDETFSIINQILETLDFLHSKDITHRDIKIENILMVNNIPKISDFGLANFPKQKRISKLNEKIGPAFTIAPEMKRISTNAEYKKADVYSIAKTIWVILTKNWLSFDGQYNSISSIGLKNYIDLKINESITFGETYYHSIVLLEKLLSDATHNDPDNRPTISEFKERFKFWLNSNNDYYLRNGIEWKDAIERIFPISTPISCSWNHIGTIKEILTLIFTNYDNLNHSFYPSHGGDDFESIDITNINKVNYLVINKSIILNPERLYFEFMNDYNWSYFRLQIKSTSPIFGLNVYEDEERLFLDSNNNVYEKDGKNRREMSLFLNGSFLIVQKTAKINELSGKLDHYSGFHNKMTHDEYKELIKKIIAG